MSRKTKVVLVADLIHEGICPGTVVSVVDLTRAEAKKVSRMTDGWHKKGAIRSFTMIPVEAVERSFKETVSLFKLGHVVVHR